MTNIGIVIGWKHNHQPGMMTKDGVITEFPGGIPSQADQDRWTAEYEAEYDSQAYARNRQAEYPSIDELVVALWEGVVEERMASVTRLEGLRQAVKTRYPK